MAQKNLLIAMIISFFVYLGNAYNGLVKRGITECLIGVIFNLLFYYVSGIFGILVFVWFIYILYDTYVCTNAINNNQPIPKFIGLVDLE